MTNTDDPVVRTATNSSTTQRRKCVARRAAADGGADAEVEKMGWQEPQEKQSCQQCPVGWNEV